MPRTHAHLTERARAQAATHAGIERKTRHIEYGIPYTRPLCVAAAYLADASLPECAPADPVDAGLPLLPSMPLLPSRTAQRAERPRGPGGVAAFMSAHSKTPYTTPGMIFSSGEGVVRKLQRAAADVCLGGVVPWSVEPTPAAGHGHETRQADCSAHARLRGGSPLSAQLPPAYNDIKVARHGWGCARHTTTARWHGATGFYRLPHLGHSPRSRLGTYPATHVGGEAYVR